MAMGKSKVGRFAYLQKLIASAKVHTTNDTILRNCRAGEETGILCFPYEELFYHESNSIARRRWPG